MRCNDVINDITCVDKGCPFGDTLDLFQHYLMILNNGYDIFP